MADTDKTDPGRPRPAAGAFGAATAARPNEGSSDLSREMTDEEALQDARWAQLADEDPSPAAGSLFDFKFTTFITPGVIRLLYIVSVVLASISALYQLYKIADMGGIEGSERFALFVMVPIMWFSSILVIRVICELILVIFCIEKNTRS